MMPASESVLVALASKLFGAAVGALVVVLVEGIRGRARIIRHMVVSIVTGTIGAPIAMWWFETPQTAEATVAAAFGCSVVAWSVIRALRSWRGPVPPARKPGE